MKLVFTYVALTPGIGIPAERFLRSALEPLKEDMARVVCEGVDRIRIQLIVKEGAREGCVIERDEREVVADCFIDGAEYKRLKSPERAELFAQVARRTLPSILRDLGCV